MQNPDANFTQNPADFSCLHSAQQTSTRRKGHLLLNHSCLLYHIHFLKVFQVIAIYFPNYSTGCHFFFPRCLPVSFARCLPVQSKLRWPAVPPLAVQPSTPPPAVFKLTLNVTHARNWNCQGKICCSMCLELQPKIQVGSGSEKKNIPSIMKCLRIRLTKKSH